MQSSEADLPAAFGGPARGEIDNGACSRGYFAAGVPAMQAIKYAILRNSLDASRGRGVTSRLNMRH